jgi:hypothetical protein
MIGICRSTLADKPIFREVLLLCKGLYHYVIAQLVKVRTESWLDGRKRRRRRRMRDLELKNCNCWCAPDGSLKRVSSIWHSSEAANRGTTGWSVLSQDQNSVIMTPAVVRTTLQKIRDLTKWSFITWRFPKWSSECRILAESQYDSVVLFTVGNAIYLE